MNKHLVIFLKNPADQILTGKKRIDFRISTRKIAPFGKVAAGDEVLVKISGGKIVGKFYVASVIFYDHPNELEKTDIKKKLKQIGGLPEEILNRKEEFNYATVIYIGQVQRFLISPQIEKNDQRGWVVLD